MDITGNKYVVAFDTAKAILHFQNQTLLTFTITEKDGRQENIVETVAVSITEVRPGLFIVTWKETSGTNVVQVQDYENGIIYSNWITPDGALKQLKGSLTRYNTITVQTNVKTTIENCWRIWTTPADILLFNNPFHDWHTAKVVTDLKAGGRFNYRMEAKDGSTGFDFAGTYDKVIAGELIECSGDDGRKTSILFSSNATGTTVTEIFEPDAETPLALQKDFCQTILDNFKKYAEQKIGVV